MGPTSLGGAPLGGGAPPGLVGPLRLPSGISFFQVFFIYSKIIPRNFSGHFELRRIAISAVALFRSRIPAAGNFPLVIDLAI